MTVKTAKKIIDTIKKNDVLKHFATVEHDEVEGFVDVKYYKFGTLINTYIDRLCNDMSLNYHLTRNITNTIVSITDNPFTK